MIEQSDSVVKLSESLVAAQAEFHPVSETADNPFFKSKYADLTAIVRAIQPVLAKHGLAICQMPSMAADDDVLVTRLVHSSGEWLQSTMRLHLGDKVTPQAHGSALTYARRYGMSAILGIVTDEDDDANASSKSPKTRAPKTLKSEVEQAQAPDLPPDPRDSDPISDSRRKRLFTIARNLGVTDEHLRQIVLGVTGDSSTSSITRGDYDRIIDFVQRGEVPAHEPSPF